MTSIQLLPDVSALFGWDFELCCEYVESVGPHIIDGCQDPVRWRTITSCCGLVNLKCEKHFNRVRNKLKFDGTKCIRCQKVFPAGTLMCQRYSLMERVK